MAYTLLTGAVGFLGRYLLRDLISAGVPVAVLLRASKSETVEERLETVMAHWDHEAGRALPRPVVLVGDVDQPNLGLDTGSLQWVRAHCDALVHSAAKVTFNSETPLENLWDTNVRGTENVVALCRDANIESLIHISTAFCCGLRQGCILEDELDVGQEFGNNYEKSKVEAEKVVRQAHGIPRVTILRPSIIVGDSQTGYTTTFHGFYLPLRITHTLLSRVNLGDVANISLLEQMGLEGTERKNVVPVDWVSTAMTHIITHPELHGKTYHLTSPEGVSAQLIQEVFVGTVRTSAQEGNYTGPQEIDLESLKEAFLSQLAVYRSHWRNDPSFDQQNTEAALSHLPCPVVDRGVLEILSDFAIRANFGWPRPPVVTPEFDVAAHLRHVVHGNGTVIPSSNGDTRRIGLEVTGSGGGQWQLRMNGQGVIDVQPGLTPDCPSCYHLNSQTFVALAQKRFSVDDAINSGRVVAIGNDLENDILKKIL